MNPSFLPPEDLPPPVPIDYPLRRKLDEVVSKYFYQTCDSQTQRVLSQCGWYLTTCNTALTLVIICPDSRSNWEVLQYLPSCGKYLKEFANLAKIRVYPAPGEGTAMEVWAGGQIAYQN
jgi:hypothetical protein